MKILAKCPYCKKRKIVLTRKRMKLPVVGIEVKSEEVMCRSCLNKLKTLSNENKTTGSQTDGHTQS